MDEAARTAAGRNLIETELEALRFHWGGAYEIEFSDEPGWQAKRLDGLGGRLTTATLCELYKAITNDYAALPVPGDQS
jgi:hypothetical protein